MTSMQETTATNDDGDDSVERRLRRLGSVCAALAAAVLVSAGGLGWRVFTAGGADWRSPAPPMSSFLAAFGGLLLVLLASAAHARILRVEEADEIEESNSEEPSWVAARLRAYSVATGVAFGMLALAAGLAVGVGTVGGAPFYGLVICLAGLFGMLAKWPRRSGFDLILGAGGSGEGGKEGSR
jgi:hypothetical protein